MRDPFDDAERERGLDIDLEREGSLAIRREDMRRDEVVAGRPVYVPWGSDEERRAAMAAFIVERGL